MTRVPPFAELLRSADPSAPGRHLFGGGFGGGGGATATPQFGTGSGGSNPNPVIAFCSDEDIARRAESDFAGLAGHSQCLARGADGGFPGAPSDPWTMASASVNFADQGVQAWDVVQVTFPKVVGGNASYPGSSQLLAVDSVAGGSITLRLLGLASGMGNPPCPPAGFGSATVQFSVPTLYPQILDASRYLRQVYGLDERIWGRRTSDLYDLTQFTEACAFKVLALRYLDRARSAGKADQDDYRAKYLLYKDELDSTLGRLSVHFIPSPLPLADVGRFGTRIVR